MNEQLKALVWKLDREVWAKVEAKEATTSWAREESAKLIQAYSDQQNKVTGETSDGYHTFNELYEHRHVLFLALLKTRTDAWKSWKHEDGSAFEGWFIAGIGDKITYHIPARLWDAFAVQELPKAPKWDGHTSNDVIERLKLLDADQQNKEKDAEIQRLTEDLQQARNSAEIAANLHGEKVNEIQRLTKEVDELTTRARHAEKQLLRDVKKAWDEGADKRELTRLRELLTKAKDYIFLGYVGAVELSDEIDNALNPKP